MLVVFLLVWSVAGCGGGDTPTGNGAEAAGVEMPGGEVVLPPPPGLPSDEEIATLRAAVERNPQDARAHHELAAALFNAYRREEALRHFEKVAELSPNEQTLSELGDAYTFVWRLDDAERVYRRILERTPRNAGMQFRLGNLALVRGNYEQAIERYREAVEIKPDYLLALYHLGFVLRLDGQYREAYTTLARLMESDPTDAVEYNTQNEALLEMASLDMTMGTLPRAEQMLRLILENDPTHASAHYVYAQLLLQLGRPEEALGELQTHMSILAQTRPTSPVAHGMAGL